jgi:ankyrin repeat protein
MANINDLPRDLLNYLIEIGDFDIKSIVSLLSVTPQIKQKGMFIFEKLNNIYFSGCNYDCSRTYFINNVKKQEQQAKQIILDVRYKIIRDQFINIIIDFNDLSEFHKIDEKRYFAAYVHKLEYFGVKWLNERKFNITSDILKSFCIRQDDKTISYLLKNNIDFNKHNGALYRTIFHQFCAKGDLKTIKFLISNKKKYNININGGIICATSNNHLDIVKYLVEYHINNHLELCSYDKRSSIMAEIKEYEKIRNYLLNYNLGFVENFIDLL